MLTSGKPNTSNPHSNGFRVKILQPNESMYLEVWIKVGGMRKIVHTSMCIKTYKWPHTQGRGEGERPPTTCHIYMFTIFKWELVVVMVRPHFHAPSLSRVCDDHTALAYYTQSNFVACCVARLTSLKPSSCVLTTPCRRLRLYLHHWTTPSCLRPTPVDTYVFLHRLHTTP